MYYSISLNVMIAPSYDMNSDSNADSKTNCMWQIPE